jgi:hypothetical protein
LDLFDIEEYHQEPKQKKARLRQRIVRAIKHSWEVVKSKQLTLADAARSQKSVDEYYQRFEMLAAGAG